MMKIKNTIKDVLRGTANCDVLREGRNESDHAHVSQSSPIALKRESLKSDPQYQADAINPAREKSTSRKRADKEVKPL